MLEFDTHKLDRLGKVYDLDVEIKVLEENPVPDVSDMTDLESRKDSELSTNNERESDSVDPSHPSQAAHPSLNGEDKAARIREYERLSALSQKKSKAAKQQGKEWEV